ncbi:MAG: PLP-dependent transferase [Bacteroidaceae bacterium]|nr:PLP-dependent transferase [Bacteroidaceae bacterium]
MKQQTLAIHTAPERIDPHGALSMPVYHSAAFEFDSAADMEGAFTGRLHKASYSRVVNPTVAYLEDKVTSLTGATATYAFNSGMAAIHNALVTFAESGKNIVTSKHLFGNTFSLIGGTLRRFGVKAKFIDLTDISKVREAVDADTCCIYAEIITNPQMEVADFRALADIAHQHNIPLIADTTIIPFTRFSAKDLGIDIEVVSSTKYISGGATSLGGLMINYGRFDFVDKRVRMELLYNLGAIMTPHAAYMQTLGLETLEARYAMQSANALAIAKALREVEGIESVNYVGLEDNPYYELSRSQFGDTAGAMLTFDLPTREDCWKLIDNVKLIRRATNLFDNRTLIIHPASTIFGNFPASVRRSMQVNDTTIRLSVGLEHPEDIINDIKQAIQ